MEARDRHATARLHHRAWRRGGSVAAGRRRGGRMRRRELVSPPASAATHPASANLRRAREPKLALVVSMVPVVVAFAAVLLTTLPLVTIHSYLATEHLVLVYLLP